MNLNDDATVAAYVDGELDATTRAQFERAMAADAGLARRVAEQQALSQRLRAAFDATLDEPVPERLVAAAHGAARGTASVLPLRRTESPGRERWRWAAPWLAAAASLVLGLVLGHRLGGDGDGSGLIVADADGPVARGALADALTSRVGESGADAGSDNVLVGLSFRSQVGEYCRTFEIDGRSIGQAGLACRTEAGAWRVDVLETLEPRAPASEGLRQAASARLPDAVRAAVEHSIDGDVLDATEERAARDAGWAAGIRQ